MRKKCLAIILAITTLLSFSYNVFAENENEPQQNIEEKVLEAKSPHAIVLDIKTGAVLYEKNANEEVYPAGLTKIMTALLVLENCNVEELVTASETALSNIKAGDSKIGIIKGERLSVRQLLYGMLLASASDAANVLAEKTAGSIEEFVKMMNSKAKELGMENTNFTNPTGEHNERHYTTPQDMSKLLLSVLKIEEFCEIVKCDSYNIPATEKSSASRKITNRNHFVSRLLRNDYYYKYSTGIMTGYTVEAKSTIAASAKKNDMNLLALVFEAETQDNVAQSFKDCSRIFDFIFENYTTHRIVKKDDLVAQIKIENTRREKKLILKAENDVSVLREKGKDDVEITYEDKLPKKISAPVTENQVIGEREYFLNGASIGTLNLVADKGYNLDPVTFVVNKMLAFVTSPWLFVFLAAVIFVLVMMERRRRRILRKKRNEARRKRNNELMQKIEM